jgi:hypothetical protein
MIRNQFNTLYREGAGNGRIMCLSLHPQSIGFERRRARPDA